MRFVLRTLFLNSRVLITFSPLFLAAPQLLTVAVLGIVILFAYSVASFVFYSAVFDPQMGLYCDTLLECFISVSRIGLLDTLGPVNFHALELMFLK